MSELNKSDWQKALKLMDETPWQVMYTDSPWDRTYPDPLSPEEYADEMDKFMRGERPDPPPYPSGTIEQLEKAGYKLVNQKQQHMQLLSIDDPILIEKVKRAINVSNSSEHASIGGVAAVLTKAIEKEGLCFYMNPIKEYPKTQSESYQNTASQNVQDLQSTLSKHMDKDSKKILVEGSMDPTPVPVFDYGTAIKLKKAGKKMARRGWNGKGMYVEYVPKVENMTIRTSEPNILTLNPHFLIKNVDNTFSTWVPSVNDILAEDWYIVE